MSLLLRIWRKHLDVDDTMSVLQISAVDGTAKTDCGNVAVSDEFEQSVSGNWPSKLNDLAS